KAALGKLATFDPRIGHPNKWIDYSNLNISRTDALANDVASEHFEWQLELKRFPKPVDRGLWELTPQTVNAYYEPTMNQITVPGVHIKGKLTLGENLADLGGLETAYAAYRRYVSRHGEPPVIDGFTGDQRFFLAYAQAWQGKRREGSLRQQLLSNPHSPEQYRVDGIVRNFDPWYKAFNVQPGDKLYLPPDRRVHVW